jgi:two-component sensor histidine kinase
MDTAVPLGIIVNELVYNSFKYSFPGRDKGEIRIKLLREEKGKRIKNGEYVNVNEECKKEGWESADLFLTVQTTACVF